jgi:CRP-like cAMP-binding protein
MSLLRQSGVIENQLLAAIPHAEYELLCRYPEVIRLNPNQTLYRVGERVRYAYFPLGGMLSLQAIAEDGKRIEIFLVGREGFVGASVLPEISISPYEVTVLIQCRAVRIRADKLVEEFNRGGALHGQLLCYIQALLRQVSQTVACINFHNAEERLCRWLLLSRDLVQSDTLHLTQERLSLVLGVSRTSVTTIAVKLQKEGLIRYRRGKITILDRQGLEAASCGCHKIIQAPARRSHVA